MHCLAIHYRITSSAIFLFALELIFKEISIMECYNEIQMNFSIHKRVFLMPDSNFLCLNRTTHIYFYYQDKQ